MMRLFRPLFLACLILMVCAGVVGADGNDSAEGQQGVPVIEVKERSFDFGTVSRGEVVKHDFQVLNRGDAPLKIENVKPG